MRKAKTAAQSIQDSLTIIDALCATRARLKIVAGVTGLLGASLIGIPLIFVSIRPEDTRPITEDERYSSYAKGARPIMEGG